jgi:hypothetical protein
MSAISDEERLRGIFDKIQALTVEKREVMQRISARRREAYKMNAIGVALQRAYAREVAILVDGITVNFADYTRLNAELDVYGVSSASLDAESSEWVMGAAESVNEFTVSGDGEHWRTVEFAHWVTPLITHEFLLDIINARGPGVGVPELFDDTLYTEFNVTVVVPVCIRNDVLARTPLASRVELEGRFAFMRLSMLSTDRALVHEYDPEPGVETGQGSDGGGTRRDMSLVDMRTSTVVWTTTSSGDVGPGGTGETFSTRFGYACEYDEDRVVCVDASSRVRVVNVSTPDFVVEKTLPSLARSVLQAEVLSTDWLLLREPRSNTLIARGLCDDRIVETSVPEFEVMWTFTPKSGRAVAVLWLVADSKWAYLDPTLGGDALLTKLPVEMQRESLVCSWRSPYVLSFENKAYGEMLVFDGLGGTLLRTITLPSMQRISRPCGNTLVVSHGAALIQVWLDRNPETEPVV